MLTCCVKTYPGGYSQCESEGFIDRPSVWCTRYGDGVDLRHTGLMYQGTYEVGTKTRSAMGRSAMLANQRLGWERVPLRGFKGSARKLTRIFFDLLYHLRISFFLFL
ncbi:hypothetical protein TNCV_634161 [Trichonephila clavipes]|nr:hypothetical protein TNCV_634161 [Trichonephila clavipes]